MNWYDFCNKILPTWITDILCVLTIQFGRQWYDPDCDGVVYYYEWLGFTFSSVSYERWFRGHNFSRHYSITVIEDMAWIASFILRCFIRSNRAIRMTRRFLSFAWKLKFLLVKHPELFNAAIAYARMR